MTADGWTVVRVWEHEPLADAAARVETAVRRGPPAPRCQAHDASPAVADIGELAAARWMPPGESPASALWATSGLGVPPKVRSFTQASVLVGARRYPFHVNPKPRPNHRKLPRGA